MSENCYEKYLSNPECLANPKKYIANTEKSSISHLVKLKMLARLVDGFG